MKKNLKQEDNKDQEPVFKHIPVLLNEVIEGLDIKKGEIFFDGTLGGAGHSREVCLHLGSSGKIISCDKDTDAIEKSLKVMKDLDCDFEVYQGPFENIKDYLKKSKVSFINKALLDLGISSFQVDASKRGFSFLKDEPLLMTMEKDSSKSSVTAFEIVNNWSQESIETILRGYGEERYARSIARGIEQAREIKKIETTFDLVEIIKKSVPKKYCFGRIHPATKTFQAIRIAVNKEIESLPSAIKNVWDCIGEGGRLAIISFHSLEDRIVKRFFREQKDLNKAILINKKPITPNEEEILSNPRARSAKLRILEKNKFLIN